MNTLTRSDMEELLGGGFGGGLACGLGIITAFVAVTSPEPFSKIALLSYGGALIGCASAI